MGEADQLGIGDPAIGDEYRLDNDGFSERSDVKDRNDAVDFAVDDASGQLGTDAPPSPINSVRFGTGPYGFSRRCGSEEKHPPVACPRIAPSRTGRIFKGMDTLTPVEGLDQALGLGTAATSSPT